MMHAPTVQVIFAAVILSLAVTKTLSQEHARKTIRYVAFTFDDLPSTHGNAANVIDCITRKLIRHKVPAIGFVNEGKLYTGGSPDSSKIVLLEQWLDANLELGNHSFSHVAIDEVPLAIYKSDVLKGEKITKQLLLKRGEILLYYRHTQLRTGPTSEIKRELDNFLKAHHYVVAPVTIDNNDYIFANIYERAKSKRDTVLMNEIGTEYLRYMTELVQHFEKLSIQFLGYEVKQVLLLHASNLNAEYLDELIEVFRQRHYQFISLDDALKDPAYQLEEAISKKGISWLHRWMLAKNIPMIPEPDTPVKIINLFHRYKD